MKIRLSAELKASIEQASAANNRTMNAEIAHRLERSFSMPDLSGHIRSLSRYGVQQPRDIIGTIVELQRALGKAHALADSLNLFEPVAKANMEAEEASESDGTGTVS